MRSVLRICSAVLTAYLLVACSSNDPKPLPVFQGVALASADAGREDLGANSTGSKAASGAAGGAAGGAAAGAAIGLACGPLAFFCVPIGAVTGGLTGMAAGGISEGGKGLSSEHSKQVNAVLEKLRAEIVPTQALYEGLRKALPTGLEMEEATAEALVTVEVRLMELRQHSDERVSLRIDARMHTTWNRDQKKPTTQTKQYVFETAREYVEDWLADDGAGFRNGLNQCMERVSNWMVQDLVGPKSAITSGSMSENPSGTPSASGEAL